MAHLQNNIVEVKYEENSLAIALIIAISSLDNYPNCKTFLQSRKLRPLDQNLL